MLNLQNVSISYEKRELVINDITLSVKEGECLGLVGANGSGKTTLLKGILGLIYSQGDIIVEGVKLDKNSMSAIRQKVGYVSSDSDSSMFMPTVYEDMMFGPLNYGIDKGTANNRIDEVLEKLKILSIKNEHNYKLSDGQKKMASIAVALTMDPKLLLMDEPSSNLDPKNRRTLINILRDLDKTMVIASHDLDLVLEVCDRVIILNKGRIVAEGESLDILANKEVLEENDLELPFCLAGLPKE